MATERIYQPAQPGPATRAIVDRAIRGPAWALDRGQGSAATSAVVPSAWRLGGRHDVAERAADRFADSRPWRDGRLPGADLRRIRVHTDGSAALAAAQLGAAAFTVGSHILFGRDRYRPDTIAGRWLLSHEVAHAASGEQGVIRRYEAFEHANIGDRHLSELRDFLATPEGQRWAQSLGLSAGDLVRDMETDPARPGQRIQVRAGVALSPGEIIALMGDFYASWRLLATAPVSELGSAFVPPPAGGAASAPRPEPGILDIVAREQGRGRSTSEDSVAYERITHGRFTDLARNNRAHFATGNRAAWRALHDEAIAAARAALSEPAFQTALLIDAAGGHFLTDAFAAGHLLNVVEVEAAIQRHLVANPIRAENPEMQTILGGLQMAGLASKLVLKNIHDRMNAEGFQVSNARGMRWTTFGDNALQRSPETQRLAALAVFLSRMQIVQARAGGAPNPEDVLALLPTLDSVEAATTRAISYIPEAVRNLPPLISANAAFLPVLGPALIGNISSPGRMRQLEMLQQQSERTGTGPLLAPQIRVLEW